MQRFLGGTDLLQFQRFRETCAVYQDQHNKYVKRPEAETLYECVCLMWSKPHSSPWAKNFTHFFFFFFAEVDLLNISSNNLCLKCEEKWFKNFTLKTKSLHMKQNFGPELLYM